jgi:hypothetical protein
LLRDRARSTRRRLVEVAKEIVREGGEADWASDRTAPGDTQKP